MAAEHRMITVGNCTINSLPPTLNLTWSSSHHAITIENDLSFNALYGCVDAGNAFQLTILGAHDVTVRDLLFTIQREGYRNGNIMFPVGQTLTVTRTLGSASMGSGGATIESSHGANKFYLNYTGIADPFLVNITFIRCDASGSRNTPIYVWKGTLTSCTSMLIPDPTNILAGCALTLAHF
jgi:hypothetical protein